MKHIAGLILALFLLNACGSKGGGPSDPPSTPTAPAKEPQTPPQSEMPTNPVEDVDSPEAPRTENAAPKEPTTKETKESKETKEIEPRVPHSAPAAQPVSQEQEFDRAVTELTQNGCKITDRTNHLLSLNCEIPATLAEAQSLARSVVKAKKLGSPTGSIHFYQTRELLARIEILSASSEQKKQIPLLTAELTRKLAIPVTCEALAVDPELRDKPTRNCFMGLMTLKALSESPHFIKSLKSKVTKISVSSQIAPLPPCDIYRVARSEIKSSDAANYWYSRHPVKFFGQAPLAEVKDYLLTQGEENPDCRPQWSELTLGATF